MQIESAFDLSAVSRAEAMGLTQLMPQLASDWA
jgi:soluble lytic murein transglycosylase-like protein